MNMIRHQTPAIFPRFRRCYDSAASQSGVRRLTMRYVVCTAIALICTNLRAQTPPARPQFEVASVKPAANDETGGGRFPTMREMMRNGRSPGLIPMTDPGRIRLKDWTLLDLIAAAYSVRATQVSGPAWLSDQGFDIEAKVPEGIPKEELNAMLQSLLEERFGASRYGDQAGLCAGGGQKWAQAETR